ncbi:MAG: LysE family translocator [Sinimarinibacterium flocculans]|uniref:LysE family translocator n=1 Tax=Sinimarinibacterium flocculans TaxID=985250 RepID=UPI003C32C288
MSLDGLPSGPMLLAFLAASVALAVTPGPGVLYVVTRTLTQGRRSGMASVAGVALGNLGNAVAAAAGLAALFAASASAFSVVKLAGAAYLLWLGLRTLRGSPASATMPPPALRGVFRDGALVALLNPKTTLFFAAFLPQFMHGSAAPAQALLLAAIFVAIAVVTDTLYVLGAGRIAPLLRQRASRSAGRWLGGVTYLGLGAWTALADLPARRP